MDETEELVNLSAGKPLGFVCHGHSLRDLERYAEELRDKLCWGSLNNYAIAEKALGFPLEFCVEYSPDYENTEFVGLRLKNAPDRGHNSLFEFLVHCIDGGVKEVFLFGADGYVSKGPSYYGGKGEDINQISLHIRDTNNFNRDFPKDHKATKIYNVSPNSKYDVFKTITYQQCVEMLNDR